MMRNSSKIYAALGLLALLLAGGLIFHIIKDRADSAPLEPFMTACVEPTLAGADDVGEACRSQDAIRQTYNIDIKAHIDQRHELMKKTARRIAEGELQNPKLYKACIAKGECADVPLLASDVDPEKMTAEQQEASTAFWDLAEKDKITKPVCDLIPECQVMVKLSVIDYGF